MVKNRSIYIMLSVILSSQIILGGGGGYKGEQFASDTHWVGTHNNCVQALIERKKNKIEQLRKKPGNEKQIAALQKELEDLSGRHVQRALEALDRGQQRLVQGSLQRGGDQGLLNVAHALETPQGQVALLTAVRNTSSSPLSKKTQQAAQESIKKLNHPHE
ncbi:hypothetical protein KBD08_02650 [Candidatus Babeliales bacterium]|nr:hypothetical protein [Candidatus Babeliales bacterium]